MTGQKNTNPALLEVHGLKKHFLRRKGFTKRIVGTVLAVDDVSFTVYSGETLALVGESGCGKTTLGRTILRAFDPTDGKAVFHLKGWSSPVNIFDLNRREMGEIRKDVAMIFQDPFSSLNPRMNVLDIVSEPFRIHKTVKSRSEREERTAELLKRVHINPDYMQRYPHAFSGGQRQRIAIARALCLNPQFIIADEPVSALDVSVQAQVLNLLRQLQAEFDLTYVFVAHNLAVVEYISTRVAVMYVGRMIELADNAYLFSTPKHPYTEALLAAVPKPDPEKRGTKITLMGDIADPANPPEGCYFHPRCLYAEAICRKEFPALRNVAGEGEPPHQVACHRAEQLSLRGVEY